MSEPEILSEGTATEIAEAIERVARRVRAQCALTPAAGRALSCCLTKLDEARLWLAEGVSENDWRAVERRKGE